MDYVTIPDVEIGSVGMEWKASNGLFTLTARNLVDVATAANDDPHIVVPRLKLGHEGWPDNDGLDNHPFAAAPSAEPAVGRAANFRLTNDGATLVVDFIDVPAWIAAAYPSRSPEWIGEVDPRINTGVTTAGGKHYSMVVTAIALLGVCWPALADIDDLPSLEHFLTTGTVLERPAVITTSTTEDQMPQPVATRADIDTVQRSFWSEFAIGDRLWWWTRDIFTDPNEVLADDDEGHLFRVPFTSNADGDIAWGEPVRVRVDLVDLPSLDAAATVAAIAASHRAVMATSAGTHRTFATAAAARPAERHTQKAAADVAAAATHQAAATAGPDNEETPMDANVLQALARQHGLDPETATEDEVNAAVIAAAPASEPETPEGEVETPVAEAEPVAAAADDGTVRIDRAAYEELQRGATMGTTARQEQLRTQRDQIVATAVSDGRIPPSRHDYWRQQLDVDTEGATVLLTAAPDAGGLAPGSVPVTERGGDEVEATATAGAITDDGDLAAGVSLLTPAERAASAARRAA